ncbi:MAG: protein TolR [Formivibrio sp.]|nr:protein TolR [Formivibrio sp.]
MARRPRRSMSQINVVPYIDVMLVLLVIFMVATPMMQQGVVNLPTMGKSDQINASPLRVEIAADGLLKLVDEKNKGDTRTLADANALVVAVQEKLAAEPERPVVIGADKSVRYELVMNAMDALKKANVARVGLQVQAK